MVCSGIVRSDPIRDNSLRLAVRAQVPMSPLRAGTCHLAATFATAGEDVSWTPAHYSNSVGRCQSQMFVSRAAKHRQIDSGIRTMRFEMGTGQLHPVEVDSHVHVPRILELRVLVVNPVGAAACE